ncbi:hypothetical protein G6F57_018358 [Rhizopus arrhizus]|nr:hypothetical protein G6F57_018358 [Rhizopus arrhizus]
MPRQPPAVMAPAPHQRHHRADDAGRRGEDRAGGQRGYRQRAGQARQRQVHGTEQLFDQVGPLDQIAHEHEQRDRDQGIVGHRGVRALHHQVQRLPDGTPRVRALHVVRQEGEQHAHAHQRERRGKPQHDRHHDQRQHQEADVPRGELAPRGQERDHQQHDPDAGQPEPQRLVDFHQRGSLGVVT